MWRFYSACALCILLIFSQTAFAGRWHATNNEQGSGTIRGLTASNGNFNRLYAVGDNGAFWQSQDGGNWWEERGTPSSERLNAITVFPGDGNDVLIAVGDNGSLLRSYDYANSWSTLSAPVNEDFLCAAYDSYNGLLWLGGANGALLYSDDEGQSWQSVNLPVPYTVKDLQPSNDGLFVAGFLGDSSYVQLVPPFLENAPLFLPADILPGFKTEAIEFLDTALYIAGNATDGSGGQILSRPFESTVLLAPELKSSGAAELRDFAGLNYWLSKDQQPQLVQRLWFITENGEVWESADGALSWQKVFGDDQGRALHALFPNKGSMPEQGQALAAGEEMFTVKRSFELQNIFPYKNEQLVFSPDGLELEFSGVPDLASVRNQVSVYSSRSGVLDLQPQYDFNDSTRVFLHAENNSNYRAVPGETWRVVVGGGIKELNPDPFPTSIQAFTYDVEFMPNSSGSMEFKSSNANMPVPGEGSAPLAGFFNGDGKAELVSVYDDRLVFFELDDKGQVSQVHGFPLNLGIAVNENAGQQLLAYDVNTDGWNDLLVFDESNVYLLLNQPGEDYTFIPAMNFHSSNLRQMSFLQADDDPRPDLLVLNDSLYLRMNIDAQNSGTYTQVLELESDIIDFAKVLELESDIIDFANGDIDANGWSDVAAVTADGDMRLYMHHGYGNFDAPQSFYQGVPYRDVILADLDLDHRLEVIALRNKDVDIYRTDDGFGSGAIMLDPVSPLGYSSNANIAALVSHEYGGFRGNENRAYKDLLFFCENGTLKILENTSAERTLSFSERSMEDLSLSFVPQQAQPWDNDANGFMDILISDRNNGTFASILNNTYAPNIVELETEQSGVRVSWKGFPETLGEFEFYRLYRDSTGPYFDNPEVLEFNSAGDTTFLDQNTRPYQTYWYATEAVYGGGLVSERSTVRQIDLIKRLNGVISGTLSDTINGIWVDSVLVVEAGTQLHVTEGVQISFAPDAFLQVDGTLTARGTERNMVGFSADHEKELPWQGIFASATADSIEMHWFFVEGARRAIESNGARVALKLGALQNNAQALVLNNAALEMRNVLLDSNFTAIDLTGETNAAIANITVVNNRDFGFRAGSASHALVRNAIFWNNGISLEGAPGSDVTIRYSTVDTMQGVSNAAQISSLAPLFETADTSFFQPALMSPTIDAGDPGDPFETEPSPNGGRVNQGLYGGTSFATATFQPRLQFVADTLEANAYTNERDTLDIWVNNAGNVPLHIYRAEVKNHPDVFSVSSVPGELEPGNQQLLQVLFRPRERKVFDEKLVIESNDPHLPFAEIHLTGQGLNRVPYFVEVPDTLARAGSLYEHPLNIHDGDGDSLIVEAPQLPDWLTLDGRLLSGTPAVTDSGSHPVQLRVSDTFGEGQTISFTIFVEFINGAPLWQGPDTLFVIEDNVGRFALADLVRDDDTAIEKLHISLLAESDTGNVSVTLTQDSLLLEPHRDYFSKKAQRLHLRATDQNNVFSDGDLTVWVNGVNDAPRFSPLADTVLYTHLEYRRKWPVYDVDGDSLTFADNTSIFNISESAEVRFIPTLQDTGIHTVILRAYDGLSAVDDTVVFDIRPNVVASAEELELDAHDRALQLSFRVPPADFYSGTLVVFSSAAYVNAPDQGTVALDSSFAPGTSGQTVQLTLGGLEIGQNYFVSVFNYYRAEALIFSRPLQGAAATPAPQLSWDNSPRSYTLPVNKTLSPTLNIRNTGGGTLLGKFYYQSDSLTNVWFHADTSQYSVAPNDSVQARFYLHPNKKMPRGVRHVDLRFVSNDTAASFRSIRVELQPVFDDFAPRVVWESTPDSVLRQSALMLHYSLDDTSGLPIGDPQTLLRSSWRLQKTGGEVVASADSSADHAVRVYPLEDGIYRLSVWGFDSEGNGLNAGRASYFSFRVQASSLLLPAKRWLMVGFPRPLEGTWQQFSDSTRRLYKWDNVEQRYLSDADFAAATALTGQAVWMMNDRSVAVDVRAHKQAALQDTLAVNIVAGWNQVAVPVGYSTFWKEMLFEPQGHPAVTLEKAGRDSVVTPAVYWYQYHGEKSGYAWAALDSAYSTPWRGFWLQSSTAGKLYFTTKAADLYEMRKSNANTGLAKGQSAQGWRLNLTLENDNYVDPGNVIGEGGSFIQSRIEEPPHFGSYCALSITANGKNWTQDIREQSGDVHKWVLRVSSQEASREHVISWNNRVLEEQGVFLFLVDPRRGTVMEMNSENSYSFTPSRKMVAFEIYASYDPSFEPVIVPETLRLEQNYPNPFNPATTIRFAVPGSDAQNVRLEVFNTLGQQVAVLADKTFKPGYHELNWKGVDHSGRPLPAGVYFYRLKAAGNQLVRKMVLIK